MQVGRPNSRTLTFVVPAGAGAYAPEVLLLNASNEVKGGLDCVDRLRVLARTLPATAEVEIDLKKPGGGDPSLDSSWNLDIGVASITAIGLSALLEYAGWPGIRIRVKSGGTGGNAVVDASWIATS
jgi:hypothetical protein